MLQNHSSLSHCFNQVLQTNPSLIMQFCIQKKAEDLANNRWSALLLYHNRQTEKVKKTFALLSDWIKYIWENICEPEFRLKNFVWNWNKAEPWPDTSLIYAFKYYTFILPYSYKFSCVLIFAHARKVEIFARIYFRAPSDFQILKTWDMAIETKHRNISAKILTGIYFRAQN